MARVKPDPDALVIVGLGARTSVGSTAPLSAAAVRAGINRFAQHPYMIDRDSERMVIATPLGGLDDAEGAARFVNLARPAATEALAPLHQTSAPWTLSACVGLPETHPGLPSDLAPNLIETLKAVATERGSFASHDLLPSGHAAGLMAIERACASLRQGGAEFCLAGGCESYLDPLTLEWLDACEQLKSETNRWGFIPGEAAAFCLLTRRATAARLQLPVWAQVMAAATAREESLIKTEAVCVGLGLTKALRGVLGALPPEQVVDHVYCDMNGERYRADEYGFTLTRVGRRLARPSEFCAPADCWGDVGAASGPLFACLAVAAGQRGYAEGPHALLWASSEGGARSAVLLSVPIHPRD